MLSEKKSFGGKMVPGSTGLSGGMNRFKPEIEKRAKEIYINRQNSKASGDELSDWLNAEKEIKSKYHMA